MSRAKEKVKLTRAEAAQRIETFLEQLKQGAVTVEDETIAVPEQVRLEVEAKSDGIEVELEWETSAEERSDADAEERTEERGDVPAVPV